MVPILGWAVVHEPGLGGRGRSGRKVERLQQPVCDGFLHYFLGQEWMWDWEGFTGGVEYSYFHWDIIHLYYHLEPVWGRLSIRSHHRWGDPTLGPRFKAGLGLKVFWPGCIRSIVIPVIFESPLTFTITQSSVCRMALRVFCLEAVASRSVCDKDP